MRKDCDKTFQVWSMCAAAALSVCFLTPSVLMAGTIRMWPAAVAMENSVRLAEVAELTGFDIKTRERLARVEVGRSPDAGGSKYISLDAVRAALSDAGFNLADIRVQGASQCGVSRPAESATDPKLHEKTTLKNATSENNAQRQGGAKADTLRRAVIGHVETELQRYGGQVEVAFDRTAENVLELAGPEYTFVVRRRGGSPLGLTPVEVDVLAGGKIVQTVPLVVQVRLNRSMLTARRAINQDARIRAEDVDVSMVTLTRLDQTGLDDVNAVIGQRAKRFIPVGTQVTPDMLESVPLVRRGELVTLEAMVGGISIITSAKADEDGRLHEVIRVRGLEGRREEFDAVVVGAGKVRLGGPVEAGEALALGGLK